MLADTAGRLHSQSHLMEELKRSGACSSASTRRLPTEVLLVLDANQGQNALARRSSPPGGGRDRDWCLTKLDGTARAAL